MNTFVSQSSAASRAVAAVLLAVVGGAVSIQLGRPTLYAAESTNRETRGTLFIVGGGSHAGELDAEFVRLAGGAGRARIAVVPMASEGAEESGRWAAEQFRGHGAEALVLNVTRREAEKDATAERLKDVTGIWFGGGDQSRLTQALRKTPVLEAIVSRYRAGAVVGGTSAGAAIMSQWMITGNQRRPESSASDYYGDEFPAMARGTIDVVRGFGFLPTAIVDQHFIRRERHNRLVSAVLERPELLGLGVDEGTAVVVTPDGRWTVCGASAAVVYDARKAEITAPSAPRLGAASVRMHILPAGASFDPSSGRATLPQEADGRSPRVEDRATEKP